LPKLAETAGAAVGLIFSAGILLSWLTTRYTPASEEYRDLTRELRETKGDGNPRHASLVKQIGVYRCRLRYMSRASTVLGWGVVLTILTLLATSVTVVFPLPNGVALAACGCLYAGLALTMVGVGLMLVELRIDRRAIEAEAEDIGEVNAPPPGRPGGG
jgi:hypothetical protein